MNEIHDLLERIDAPPVAVSDDIARGERALRRRRNWQLSAGALSLAAVVGVGVAIQGMSGTSAATGPEIATTSGPTATDTSTPKESCGSQTCAQARHRVQQKVLTAGQRVRQINRQLLDPRTQQTLQAYHDVVAEHLDPTGTKLRLAENEQGGTGHFGTKFDWDGGGMLMISVSSSWRTSDWNAYPPGPGQRTSFRGHEARVLVDGSDTWVAVEHDDGQVVMLLATPQFGNNGTSISSTGLTVQQLLDTAADPRLQLPAYAR